MSIYCTWFDTDRNEDLGAPWVYKGSHILPQETDERDGYVSISSIPNHIERDYAGPGLHDWLRVSIGDKINEDGVSIGQDMDIILNRAQVEAVRNTLNLWLNEPERF